MLASVEVAPSSDGPVARGDALYVALFDRCVTAGSMWTAVERSAVVCVGLGQCDRESPVEIVAVLRPSERG